MSEWSYFVETWDSEFPREKLPGYESEGGFTPDRENTGDLFQQNSGIPHGPHTLWGLRDVIRLAKTKGYEGTRGDPSLFVYRKKA